MLFDLSYHNPMSKNYKHAAMIIFVKYYKKC